MIPKPTVYVLDGCRTFLRHIFRPSISVHFRNLFVSHIALPVKCDIKKPCQQHIQVRCPWKYESNHWKCLLLLIRRFRIGHTTFRWFLKMYFRFPRRHIDISGIDVIELYTAINSPRSPWQFSKAHGRISYSFGATEAIVDWGAFYPPAAGIRDIQEICWANIDHTSPCELVWTWSTLVLATVAVLSQAVR